MSKSKIQNKSQIGYRPTWAEINLRNLAYNFYQVKKLLDPQTKVLVTVKADAYGHGLVAVSKKLVALGADYLGVASIDEGIRLRDARIKLPILILGMVLKNDIAAVLQYGLIPTVCTLGLAEALNDKARSLKKKIDIHIKVDTGMGRLGILHQDALGLIMSINRLKFINIEGLFTHFAFADQDREFTLYQIKLFDRLIEKLKEKGIFIPLLHAANSIGAIDFKQSHFNMVRPGLVIYGLHPKEKLKIKLKPVLRLKTKIVYFKRLPKGSGVSYGHIYVTKKKATVVLLPIGYGYGYPRNLSNLAPVLIHGKRFKVSGRVCMDQLMVDVGDLKVRTGEEAVLIGSQGKGRISAEELAKLSGTIPYEIVCGLGSRIPRIYID